jgi:hypothetical protein
LFFAVIMLVLVIFEHVLVFSEPMATRIGYGVMLLLVLIILVAGFSAGAGTSRNGAVLGWSGALRLVALAFAMIIVVAFAIAMPVQVFLSNHLSPAP